MLVNNTPFELRYLCCGIIPVLVKREDLCCPPPGPSFSKMRGVIGHLRRTPETTVGVLDTLHSKAGWAVAYAGQALGKKVIDYWPRFKRDGDTLLPRVQQRNAQALGATMVDLPAGRSAILYHQAKKHLAANYPGAYMMPNALKLPESVEDNAAEVVRSAAHLPSHATLVISVSSGTVAAGVLLGLHRIGYLRNYDVVLHLGYSRSPEAVRAYIDKAAGVPSISASATVVDEGYGYADEVSTEGIPFPCNPHYDAKAWRWLDKNVIDIAGPLTNLLFWNIGE